jgi:hypothetical protein
MFIFEDSIGPKKWLTTDPGFNDVLRAHIVRKKGEPISEVYFQRVLEAAKYCEHSYYEFGPDFDTHVYRKAKSLCEKLGIQGFWVGEGGGGDDF